MQEITKLTFNKWFIDFFKQNWLLLVLFLPIIPPKWLGYASQYFNTVENKLIPARKSSIAAAFIMMFVDAVSQFTNIFVNLASLLTLRTATTVIIFIAIGFDIFFRKQISREAITLISIGVIALYLEQLIEKAKKIVLFWKILEWESKDTTSPTNTSTTVATAPQQNEIASSLLTKNIKPFTKLFKKKVDK